MEDFVQNDLMEFKQTIKVDGEWVTPEEAERREREREEKERRERVRKYMRDYRANGKKYGEMRVCYGCPFKGEKHGEPAEAVS